MNIVERGRYVNETGMVAYREVFDKVGIYSCEGNLIALLPGDFTDRDIDLWVEGYDAGYRDGRTSGEIYGKLQFQKAVLRAIEIEK